MSTPARANYAKIGLEEKRIVAALGAWAEGHGPLYARLGDALARAVERGDVAAGTRLPAERNLARALGISRSTVVASYDRLADLKRLERRQGSGTYVPNARPTPVQRAVAPDANQMFRGLITGSADTIDFSMAAPTAAPEVAEALRRLADYVGNAEELGRGYLPAGLPALRTAIAGYLTEIGVPSAERQVLVTSGGQQAISLLASLWISPGDTVVVENPSYHGALDAFRAAGARLLAVPVDADGVRVDMLKELLARTSARLVYVTPSYNNPTGTLLSQSRRRELARAAQDFQVPLIEDLVQFESPLIAGAVLPPVSAFGEDGWVTTVGSMSKLFWGGLRIGWVRGAEQTIFRLAQLKAVADLGTSMLSQMVCVDLLAHVSEMRVWRQADCRRKAQALSDWLAEYLPEWTWDAPAGGNDFWVRLPQGNATDFLQLAARYGVAAAAGPLFSADGGFAEYVRLTFLMDDSDVKEGVRRLAEAWRAYVPRSALTAARVEAVV